MSVGDPRADRETIGALVSRAVSDGRDYAMARVEVAKQTALTGFDAAKGGIVLLVVAGLLGFAALIVLLVAIFTWLADEIGPLGSGLVVTGVTLVVAYLMVRAGLAKITAATAAVKGKIN